MQLVSCVTKDLAACVSRPSNTETQGVVPNCGHKLPIATGALAAQELQPGSVDGFARQFLRQMSAPKSTLNVSTGWLLALCVCKSIHVGLGADIGAERS